MSDQESVFSPLTSEALLRVRNPESVSARLILAVGSHAGAEAPLQDGYYMIGRHEECQIRPKSRSVSRRHCLLYCHFGELHVRDLDSSSGTKVNGQKVEGNQWARLNDGDTLRCGKVAFNVTIEPASKSESNGRDVRDDDASNQRSMVVAKPWQDVDIAEMLESEDEAERADRYDRIRAGDTDINLEVFAEAFDEEVASQPSPSIPKPNSNSTRQPKPRPKADVDRESKPRRNMSTRPKSAKKKGLRFSGPTERHKVMAAALLVVTACGVVTYQAYQFTAGPSVRVIDDID